MLRSVLLITLTAWAATGKASGPFLPMGAPDQAGLDSLFATMLQQEAASEGENVRWVSSGLAVLLGPFAAHRLYLGTTPKVAIIYGLTFGGFGVLVLLDLGHLLFTKDLDRYRNSDRVFMWSKPEEDPAPTTTPP